MYMPFMDGLELANAVRKLDTHNKVKIILLSADDPSDEFKSKKLFDEILVKPMKISKLDEMSNWIFSKNEVVSLNYIQEHKKS